MTSRDRIRSLALRSTFPVLALALVHCASAVRDGGDADAARDDVVDASDAIDSPRLDTPLPPIDVVDDDATVADEPPPVADVQYDSPLVTAWPATTLEPVVDMSAAYGRTQLVVAGDGTIWIAYRQCDSATAPFCPSGRLRVAHASNAEGTWTYETAVTGSIDQFAMAVPSGGLPVIVYEDAGTNEVAALTRDAAGTYSRALFPQRAGLSGDSIAMLAAGDTVYFAYSNGQRGVPMELWQLSAGMWTRRASSPAGPDDAWRVLERGMAANAGALWLGARWLGPSDTRVGLVVYRPDTDAWNAPVETAVGMAARSGWLTSFGDGVCFASEDAMYKLTIVCMDSLSHTTSTVLSTEQIFGDVALVTMPSGARRAVYDQWSERHLKVATNTPGSSAWDIETVGLDEAYGISAGIDASGHVVASYLTCPSTGMCTLRVAHSVD